MVVIPFYLSGPYSNESTIPESSLFYKRALGVRKGGGGGHGGGGGEGGGSGGKGSSGSSGGKGSDPSTSKSGTPYSSSSSSFKTTYSSSSAYGLGTSSRSVIPAGSPFAGRYVGGGLRSSSFGAGYYGSGYPYGYYGSWVAGRPFPFGFWPVYYYPHYYGDDEYGPENNSSRPGGPQMFAAVASNDTEYDTSDAYYIMGDQNSVRAVLDALVLNCSVVNSTIEPYSASNRSQPQPEQAIQYYRSSSFVLYAEEYNNTAALPANAPASNDSTVSSTPTPLPSLDAEFLECLNATIGESVPMSSSAPCMGPNGLVLVAFAWLVLAMWKRMF